MIFVEEILTSATNTVVLAGIIVVGGAIVGIIVAKT
jgi:hypothetical protein